MAGIYGNNIILNEGLFGALKMSKGGGTLKEEINNICKSNRDSIGSSFKNISMNPFDENKRNKNITQIMKLFDKSSCSYLIRKSGDGTVEYCNKLGGIKGEYIYIFEIISDKLGNKLGIFSEKSIADTNLEKDIIIKVMEILNNGPSFNFSKNKIYVYKIGNENNDSYVNKIISYINSKYSGYNVKYNKFTGIIEIKK